MKKKFYLIAVALLFSLLASSAERLPLQQNQSVSFTPNRGQVRDQNGNQRPDVLFGGFSGQLAFHLRDKGISYQLSSLSYKLKQERIARHKAKGPEATDKVVIQRVDINWLGANANEVLPGLPVYGYSNFYLDGTAITGVQAYEGVTYKNLYKNIDLHYYDNKGVLEYDFIVSPGADYHQIQLEIKGATSIKKAADGSLIINTPLGEIKEGTPVVFQEGKQLLSSWHVNGQVISFDVKGVDPTKVLLIDPTTRLWGSYYGGSGDEALFYVTNTTSNDAIGVGASTTVGGTIIATSGSYQNTFGGGQADAFIVKFNGTGQRQWSTYYGGAGDELFYCAAIDGSGNIVVSGSCDDLSGAVLSSGGSHQPVPGGSFDAFLVKFTSAGTRIWGTYYGGINDEESTSCAVDASGNIFMSGYTDSNVGTVIATAGAHQSSFGGSYDAFLVKFDGAGVRQWGTYYGGTTDDLATFVCTDASGNAIIGGGTDSNTDIASTGGFLTGFQGNFDAFMAKFNSAGVRQWGTYYGGSGYEEFYMLKTDASGNIYYVGDTESNSGISTTGSHQPNYAANGDAFVGKFSGAGAHLWGSYYGGLAYDDSYACAVDANGNVYLSGSTETPSGSAIATGGNHQSTFGGGTMPDGYLVKFNTSGVRQWGTYYGGTGDEISYCSVDAAGDPYICGYTSTSAGSSIASAGSHQTTYGGGQYDGYIAKFSSCTAPPTPTVSGNPSSLDFCSAKGGTLIANGLGAMQWYTTATGGSAIGTGSAFPTGTLSPGTYTYFAEANDCAVSPGRASITFTVKASPSLTLTSNRNTICIGESASLTVAGADTYAWNGGATTSVNVVSPSSNSIYVVVGSSANSCTALATINLAVTACVSLKELQSEKLSGIYPNPNSGEVFLNTATSAQVRIFNALGMLIHKQTVESGTTRFLIDGPAGIYFVRVQTEQREQIHKMVLR